MTHTAENDAPCRCDCAYVGAQPVGTPVRCERCRGLVDEVAAQRMDAVYAEARRRLEADGTPDPNHRCDLDGCDGSRIGHDLAATFATRVIPPGGDA